MRVSPGRLNGFSSFFFPYYRGTCSHGTSSFIFTEPLFIFLIPRNFVCLFSFLIRGTSHSRFTQPVVPVFGSLTHKVSRIPSHSFYDHEMLECIDLNRSFIRPSLQCLPHRLLRCLDLWPSSVLSSVRPCKSCLLYTSPSPRD